MSKGIHAYMLVAGAAALLSSQAVAAAPPAGLDPLVSLSVLGTAQSRAAVCASTLAAGAAAAVAQAPAPGCVLPVTAPPAPPVVTQVAPPLPPPPVAGPGIGVWPLLLGLAAIVGLAALLLSGGGDGDGDLTPISP